MYITNNLAWVFVVCIAGANKLAKPVNKINLPENRLYGNRIIVFAITI